MKQLQDYLYYWEKNPDLKIYCGDCLEVMPLLPKVDLVVTDPPYGIDGKTKLNSNESKGSYEGEYFKDSPDYIRSVVVPIVERAIKTAKGVK